MREDEIQYVQKKVKSELIPEIKKLVPGILGFLLRAVFPKMEQKVIDFIIRLTDSLLADRLLK